MFPESVVPEAGWPAGVTLAGGNGVVVNFQGGQVGASWLQSGPVHPG